MSYLYFILFFKKPCCLFPSNTAFLQIFLPRQALGTPLTENSGKKQLTEPEFWGATARGSGACSEGRGFLTAFSTPPPTSHFFAQDQAGEECKKQEYSNKNNLSLFNNNWGNGAM